MMKEKIIGKIIMAGELVLQSPLSIGDGQSAETATDKDIKVLKDGEGGPFIPGTSMAGCLRDMICQLDSTAEEFLFGDKDKAQSSLIIEDVVFPTASIAYRDGVSIDAYTGSGIETAKYDYEVVERGAKGEFYLEMTLRGYHAGEDGRTLRPEVREAVQLLGAKLADGLAVGAQTAKGLGRIKVEKIAVGWYDFNKAKDVKAWLSQEKPMPEGADKKLPLKSGLSLYAVQDFVAEVKLTLNAPLIIRDYAHKKYVEGADSGRKKEVVGSLMDSKGQFLLPGTTVKGVLRHQAESILRSLHVAPSRLTALMGTADAVAGDKATEGRIKSRFMVEECYLAKESIREIEQTRNRIDRFTGGVIDAALFTTAPLWADKSAKDVLTLRFVIKGIKENAQWEAGLAMFLLKDLAQGKIAFGGEKGIGRGTMQALTMDINYRGRHYVLDSAGKVTEGDVAELNKLAVAFSDWAAKAVKEA